MFRSGGAGRRRSRADAVARCVGADGVAPLCITETLFQSRFDRQCQWSVRVIETQRALLLHLPNLSSGADLLACRPHPRAGGPALQQVPEQLESSQHPHSNTFVPVRRVPSFESVRAQRHPSPHPSDPTTTNTHHATGLSSRLLARAAASLPTSPPAALYTVPSLHPHLLPASSSLSSEDCDPDSAVLLLLRHILLR